MDGKLIAERRKEKGLTQDELGALLGISGKAVSKWERGLSSPDCAHAEKLCQLLGLPVEKRIKTTEQRTAPFLSLIRTEFLRMLATALMIASCIGHLQGVLSLNSTVVSLGFSVVLFFFKTMTKQ